MSLRATQLQNLRNDGYDDLADYILDLEDIVRKVAHIGADFGYGSFQIGQDDVCEAQEVLSKGTDIECIG